VAPKEAFDRHLLFGGQILGFVYHRLTFLCTVTPKLTILAWDCHALSVLKSSPATSQRPGMTRTSAGGADIAFYVCVPECRVADTHGQSSRQPIHRQYGVVLQVIVSPARGWRRHCLLCLRPSVSRCRPSRPEFKAADPSPGWSGPSGNRISSAELLRSDPNYSAVFRHRVLICLLT
jgi:hypothetical protein